MGTQEGERDWVDVANDLLSKCHINLKLRKLTECDANVFIALYENILGEQVPDFIAEPRSQEDDIHNIQSVIDSLSLDYLQISLSHITGENVVRSDKESLKNLLEIFDGLLEYLNEEINEESQDGGELTDSLNEAVRSETEEPTSSNAVEQKGGVLDAPPESSNGGSTVQSRRPSEAGSTGQVIGLGISARTFTDKQEDRISTSEPLDDHEVPTTVQPLSNMDPHPPSRSPTLTAQITHAEEEAKPPSAETSRQGAETAIENGLRSPAVHRSPAQSERSVSSQRRADNPVEGRALEPTNGGPRRVLFHTQPDVLFLTLQDEIAASSSSSVDTEEEEVGEEEELSYTARQQAKRMGLRDGTGLSQLQEEQKEKGSFKEPLSYRRQRNRRAEKELHHISANLSHRLEELDQMLKRVLGESGEPSEIRDEDKHSHHSDSVMERRRTPGLHTGATGIDSTQRARSLSPSPPRLPLSPLPQRGQFEKTTTENPSLDGSIGLYSVPLMSRRTPSSVDAHSDTNRGTKMPGDCEMLKRVLGKSGEPSEVRDEDKHSHHSDSVMERRRTPGLHTVSGATGIDSRQHTRSLSPSPPRLPLSPLPQRRQFEGTPMDTPSLDDGRQRNLTASDHTRRGEPCRTASLRKHRNHLANKVYEEQLKRYEERKQADLDRARLKAQEAEREYREAILRDVSQDARPSPAKTKAPHKSQRGTQSTAGRTRKETSRREPTLNVKENELLPVLLEELPHLHISPKVLGQLWEQQMHQVDRLHAARRPGRTKLSSELEEAQRRHDLLVGIVSKEQDHNRRLKDFRERIQQQKSSQRHVREQRQQAARARKYYNDYHVQHRARLMRERTKEERMFRQLFEEGLELQRVRLREQRDYVREQRMEQQRRFQDHVKSMENYYKDQFSLLAEKLAQERQEVQVRKKAQEKALLKMKRELRSRMEREIGELQRIIIQNDEEDYFQGLEVQRLRNRVRMASFQHNTSYLH